MLEAANFTLFLLSRKNHARTQTHTHLSSASKKQKKQKKQLAAISAAFSSGPQQKYPTYGRWQH